MLRDNTLSKKNIEVIYTAIYQFLGFYLTIYRKVVPTSPSNTLSHISSGIRCFSFSFCFLIPVNDFLKLRNFAIGEDSSSPSFGV